MCHFLVLVLVLLLQNSCKTNPDDCILLKKKMPCSHNQLLSFQSHFLLNCIVLMYLNHLALFSCRDGKKRQEKSKSWDDNNNNKYLSLKKIPTSR